MTPREFKNLSPQEQIDVWASLSESDQKDIREVQKEHQVNREAETKAKRIPIKPAPPLRIRTPKEILDEIRSNTCYKSLRIWLRGGLLGVIGAEGATEILAIIALFRSTNEVPPWVFMGSLITIIVFFIIAVSFSLAVYQASLILIDIADTTIQSKEKKDGA